MTVRTRLWKCPSCGERFTTANQWHSCGKYELAELLDGCAVSTVELFDQFSGLVHTLGPVRVIPQKTRVAYQTRMRFAAIIPRRRCLRGHLVLARHRPAPFFTRVPEYSRRNVVHEFRIDKPDDFTPQFRDWLEEAYRVGCQECLQQPPEPHEN